MSTAPSPAPATPNWISLLINLGASLGATFIKNNQIASLITSGVATTTAIINAIQQAKATNTATASNLTVPIFVAVLTDVIQAAVVGGKLSAAEATELNKALQALATEDAIAKTTVDYSTIGPIAPLPTQ